MKLCLRNLDRIKESFILVKILGKESGKVYYSCLNKSEAFRWLQKNFPDKGVKKSVLTEAMIVLCY